ncbi:hypothetical protein C0Q70_19137 [Pomacea canaliculata]|uniref:Uncharacterized protein n=1 Tax=Pomacea canaliculata TaxID=400727 RepID=A0A2T7NIG7_POMCA|nr:hypothetical protein C0Q70_19137 [Pomacea canaliculata]
METCNNGIGSGVGNGSGVSSRGSGRCRRTQQSPEIATADKRVLPLTPRACLHTDLHGFVAGQPWSSGRGTLVQIDKFQLMTSLKMWRDNNRDNGDQKERSGCARAHKGGRDRNADSNLWIKSLQSSLRQSNRQEVAISPDGVQSCAGGKVGVGVEERSVKSSDLTRPQENPHRLSRTKHVTATVGNYLSSEGFEEEDEG